MATGKSRMDAIIMISVRQSIGGLGNLMFKEAYLMGKVLDGENTDVYLQSEKYWKNHAAEIKNKFGQGIGRTEAVALHIRRGDYVNNPFYVNLWETNYYKQALALFPHQRFIVFCRDNQNWDTDKADRQWCRGNLVPLIGHRFELASKDNTETDDMNLMASCTSIIMANSSFSWWASYLNPNPDKKIICPKQWFSDGVQRCEPQPDWILI